MRDPERIDRILSMIRYHWMQSPDQRLGQLLANLTDREMYDEAWNEEDSELEAHLLKSLGATKEQVDELLVREEVAANKAWGEFFDWQKRELRPGGKLWDILHKERGK